MALSSSEAIPFYATLSHTNCGTKWRLKGQVMGKLNVAKVRALSEPGRYVDGDGLALRVRANGAKSWILRLQANGTRRDFSLGSAKYMSLAEARDAAVELRRKLARGVDPIAERKQAQAGVLSFREAAKRVHEEHKAAWRNGKHQNQWFATLETYAFPKLGDLPVDKIEGPAIREVLLAIWLSKPETARRVRQRIAAVLDWAYASGMRSSEAPLRSLSKGLPRQPKKDRHFAALAYENVPQFVWDLRERSSVGRLALEFLILTAARSGEVRFATWTEIGEDDQLWSIPADRMKMGRPHQVPLSPQARGVLQRARAFRVPASNLIFPGQKSKRPLSDMTLLKVVRDMKLDVTVHGFRSAFRDWVAETTDYPGEVAEAALAHSIPNKVEAAYRRTDYLAKRGGLMREWGEFCLKNTGASRLPPTLQI